MSKGDHTGTLGSREGGTPSSERGQTTLDFALGISIFLTVLIFIFLFIPGMLSPFTNSAQGETVASNRVADQLSKQMLSQPSEPYVLDRYCTVEFFEETDAADDTVPAQCEDRYDDGSVESQVGLDEDRTRLNVTIEGNLSDMDESGILCWNDATGLEGESDCPSDVPLTRGDAPPPNSAATVTAQRVVSMDGTDVTLYVVIW